MEIQAERGLLGLVAIGSEASEQVDEEIDGLRWRECSIWQTFLS